MGLDLICGSVSERCGSYSYVHEIRYLLLCALKEYLEMETRNYNERVDYLCLLITKENTIQYDKADPTKHVLFHKKKLNGFFPFIFHSDCNGSLSSYEAKQFLKTFDIVKDYVDYSLKYDDKFFLDSIFRESISSGQEIHFV
jgi:hypothetical protein